MLMTFEGNLLEDINNYAFKNKIQKLMAISMHISDPSISNWPILVFKVMKQANYYSKDHCFNLKYFPTMSDHLNC